MQRTFITRESFGKETRIYLLKHCEIIRYLKFKSDAFFSYFRFEMSQHEKYFHCFMLKDNNKISHFSNDQPVGQILQIWARFCVFLTKTSQFVLSLNFELFKIQMNLTCYWFMSIKYTYLIHLQQYRNDYFNYWHST